MKPTLRIGARTLKTALAVVLCLLVDRLIPQTSGVYSCLSAVICMMPTADQTLATGINRSISTLLAGAAGAAILALYTLMPGWYEYARILLIPLFIIALITVCNLIHRTGSVYLACAIFIILALGPYQHISDVMSYIGWRMLETLIGIFIAMTVNRYIRPYKDKA